ncbi:L-2-amino-thiazoline-4-carboxylic acid hydrolase [Desulfovibrio sp. TomC]|uniref:L-2-amino-thiazoline-4-carboxylic acid hydrolase n=1 Tax=Desulfovibrio sp. TomC TaxID=1562888 RepID=UPI000574585E|nr:L-2-amino-thiazoline-4-carboxylic acid hydrolase [Desulfovibrio sp. TomC]KHK03973.1 L-2-amino-thiazoline-4-carboxylic acid hydrolase [Desulfovibrio sp. TomC]
MGIAPGTGVALLEKRCIEAAMLADVYAVLQERQGRDAALAVIEETVARASFAAGKAFAATAPDGPNLAHFATVTSLWQRGEALCIENVRQTPDRLSFEVTRCRYAESYRAMGLPEELVVRISCLRDGDFAAGYSPALTFARPATIASGAPAVPSPSPGTTHEHTTHHR